MNEIQGRKVAVLAEDLYEDLELWYPTIRLREAGAAVALLGTGQSHYTGKHGLPVKVDAPAESANVSELDGLVIPGGYAPDRLRRHAAVLKLVRDMDRAGKLIAFICHAGWVPASAGILKDRRITSFFSIRDDMEHAGAQWTDDPVVVDGNLVTSRSPDDLPDFCHAIISYLAG
jgi:protease I